MATFQARGHLKVTLVVVDLQPHDCVLGRHLKGLIEHVSIDLTCHAVFTEIEVTFKVAAVVSVAA